MNSKLKGQSKDSVKLGQNKAGPSSTGLVSRDTARPNSAFHAKRAHITSTRPPPTSSIVSTTGKPSKRAPPPTSSNPKLDKSGKGGSSEQEFQDEIREKTSLSLAGHPLPPLSALVKTLSQFRKLQRLDLSALLPSDVNPHGLTRLDWLAKAVFRTQQETEREDYLGTSTAFGHSLTWLNVSNNAELTSEGCIGLEALEQLRVLTFSSCNLQELPLSINPLKNLRALVLNNNALTELPSSFPHLPQLNSLILSHNKLKELPASLPASLPALKKLSVGHNQLRGSISLPDFSVCLSLRDVRINDNEELGALPSHINMWGKGADGNTAPGLELLELKGCGLDSWDALSTLVPSSRNPQPHGRKGLAQLMLKGNGVALLDDYKERILEAHPTIRVLDNERLHTREKRMTAESIKETSEGKTAKSHVADRDIKVSKVPQSIERALQTADKEGAESALSLAEEVDSESDDEQAAQMAAEMRAMRKGQSQPSFEKTLAASRSQNGISVRDEKVPGSSTAKVKHKRGTRSIKKGKDQNLAEAQSGNGKTACRSPAQSRKEKNGTSAVEPFFEVIDQDAERARLASVHQLQSQQAKIASGRTDLKEGVLEDVREPAFGKARRLESKTVHELEMTDAADDRHSTSAKHKKIKLSPQNDDQEKTNQQHNSSVASIVDLRSKGKTLPSNSVAQNMKRSKKSRVGELPPVRKPFMASNVTDSDHLGAGGDAWGVSGAWS